LWLCGFQNKEHISDMLARTRIRLGFWWWVLSVSTLAGDLYLLAINVPDWWKVAIFSAAYVFLAWLFDHILHYTRRERKEKFTRKHWRRRHGR
jgi:nitrate reductase gamma subunit